MSEARLSHERTCVLTSLTRYVSPFLKGESRFARERK